MNCTKQINKPWENAEKVVNELSYVCIKTIEDNMTDIEVKPPNISNMSETYKMPVSVVDKK